MTTIWQGKKWQIVMIPGGELFAQRLGGRRKFQLRYHGMAWGWSQDVASTSRETLDRLPDLMAHLRHQVDVPLC